MMTEFGLQCTRVYRHGIGITMKKALILLLEIIFVSALLISCSTNATDPADAFKGESQQQIFATGQSQLKDRNFSEAIKHFEALDVQYPYGAETERAQLYLIYAYYMKEDYALSIAAADHFIRLHPTNPNIAYAYYMRGLANYYQNQGPLERLFNIDKATRDLSAIKKSYDDFGIVANNYAYSPYAPSAYQYMIYLRNVLADYEVHIAEYYYEHRAYVAAANRGSWLVAHYQGAPQTIDGLVIMAKSYHQLGLKRLEDDTLKVIHYNYPNLVVNYNENYGVVLR